MGKTKLGIIVLMLMLLSIGGLSSCDGKSSGSIKKTSVEGLDIKYDLTTKKGYKEAIEDRTFLTLELENATVDEQVSTGILGDTDSDGEVTIEDSLLTAQYYISMDLEYFDTTVADVNGDTVINITDALLIAQYYSGQITSFPVEAMQSYTVSFDTDGGSTIEPVTLKYGVLLGRPEVPVKAGSYFAGWYKDEAFTQRWNFSADTVTADTISDNAAVNIVLYAKWASLNDFEYETGDDGSFVIITGYTGSEAVLATPAQIDGKPVQVISESVFGGNETVEDVTLTGPLTGVLERTFKNCVNLKSVTIEDQAAVSVQKDTFAGCAALTEASFGNSVQKIGDENEMVFYDSDNLRTVKIGSSVTFISQDFVRISTKLTDIIVDRDNRYYKSIDGVLFYAPTDKDIYTLLKYPAGKMETDYTVPAMVTDIAPYAFYCAGNIQTVSFAHDSVVTSIGNHAFYACTKLSTIILPASVTSLGEDNPFGFCDIEEFVIAPGNSHFYTIDGVLFDSSNVLRCYPFQKKDTSYEVPDSTTGIGNWAFSSNFYLKEVSINEGVTEIGNNAFNCAGLVTIAIPASVRRIGYAALDNTLYLMTVYFMGTNPPELEEGSYSTGVFDWDSIRKNNTQILVPAGSVDTYLNAWGIGFERNLKAQ
ncbi:MAG: leucine-rich repeat protein [Spirochaetes bacterium]|nr:leucine-rich repeat protein [Spirochaetota bacterium]MBN2772072.1 leucine-rich repeat protein [Spirochaetota bacterium]